MLHTNCTKSFVEIKDFFFLERAGELRIVVLIGRKNGPITMLR